MIDWGLLLILGLGILLGALVANSSFRRKFFVGFRSFLGGVNIGKTQRRKDVDESNNAAVVQEQRDVKRRYIRTVKLVQCSRCQGSGKVKRPAHPLADKRLAREQYITCPDCKGTGEVEE